MTTTGKLEQYSQVKLNRNEYFYSFCADVLSAQGEGHKGTEFGFNPPNLVQLKPT
jgi:hypothetical protein